MKNKAIARRVFLRVSGAVALACILVSAPLMGGCAVDSPPSTPSSTSDTNTSSAPEPVLVRVASLKGPTSIGLADFIEEARSMGAYAESNLESGTNPSSYATASSAQSSDSDVAAQNAGGLYNTYTFDIVGTADEILPRLVSGDLDIALIPANAASVLYNRTNGGIKVLNINTLGVLYVLSADSSISTMQDLSGRTVLMTGKGTTPEYVMNALLDRLGITDVHLEYKSEASELAAVLSSDPTAIAVLPEPYVTSLTTKNPAITVRISLTDEWNAVATDGSQLVTGVTVVRSSFAAEHPEAVEEFLLHQQESVAITNLHPASAGEAVARLGIIDSASIVATAIPRCNLVCITGTQMQQSLDSYLAILFAQDPASIGGAMPLDDFYYIT